MENSHGKDSISYTVRAVRAPVAPTIRLIFKSTSDMKCARMICQLTSYENHWLRVSKISTDTIALVWSRPHNGGALIQGACLDHEDGDHGDKDDV